MGYPSQLSVFSRSLKMTLYSALNESSPDIFDLTRTHRIKNIQRYSRVDLKFGLSSLLLYRCTLQCEFDIAPLPCMLKLFLFGKIEPMFRGVNFRYYWFEAYLTVVDVFQTKLKIMWLSET
jgi:hypothetical protein